MMGRRERRQGPFFYVFDLERVVPADHLVRQIDAVLDLSRVHEGLAPYYSHTGRPSIDPLLMIRMLIVGYVFAIRSERRICAEVQVNLAYRWFCKLRIEDRIPDHSVFCRARHERFVRVMPCAGFSRTWWRCSSSLIASSDARRFVRGRSMKNESASERV
jgi:transposase